MRSNEAISLIIAKPMSQAIDAFTRFAAAAGTRFGIVAVFAVAVVVAAAMAFAVALGGAAASISAVCRLASDIRVTALLVDGRVRVCELTPDGSACGNMSLFTDGGVYLRELTPDMQANRPATFFDLDLPFALRNVSIECVFPAIRKVCRHGAGLKEGLGKP